jgi:hypothetical protein
MCPSDDDEMSSSCTRERDGYEIRVVPKPPKCACYCEPPKKTDSGTTVTRKEEDATAASCPCVGPDNLCYKDHYDGVCGCDCEGGDGCCDCIVLARIVKKKDGDVTTWTPDHGVRRFIRPVLMRDPIVWREAASKRDAETAAAAPIAANVTKRKGKPPQA